MYNDEPTLACPECGHQVQQDSYVLWEDFDHRTKEESSHTLIISKCSNQGCVFAELKEIFKGSARPFIPKNKKWQPALEVTGKLW